MTSSHDKLRQIRKLCEGTINDLSYYFGPSPEAALADYARQILQIADGIEDEPAPIPPQGSPLPGRWVPTLIRDLEHYALAQIPDPRCCCEHHAPGIVHGCLLCIVHARRTRNRSVPCDDCGQHQGQRHTKDCRHYHE